MCHKCEFRLWLVQWWSVRWSTNTVDNSIGCIIYFKMQQRHRPRASNSQLLLINTLNGMWMASTCTQMCIECRWNNHRVSRCVFIFKGKWLQLFLLPLAGCEKQLRPIFASALRAYGKIVWKMIINGETFITWSLNTPFPLQLSATDFSFNIMQSARFQFQLAVFSCVCTEFITL